MEEGLEIYPNLVNKHCTTTSEQSNQIYIYNNLREIVSPSEGCSLQHQINF